jgi:AI-2 transport protein TqsA
MRRSLRAEQNWLATISLMVIAFVVGSAGLAYTRAVMVPFVLAIFIATTVAPLVDYQVLRLRAPRPLALITVLLLVFGIVTAFTILMLFALESIATTAREYSDSFLKIPRQLAELSTSLGLDVDTELILYDLRSRLPRMISQSAGTAMSFVSLAALTVIFVFFLLLGRDSARVRTGIAAEIDSSVRRYIATKFVISGVTGILVWAILALFGLRMAGLFGMLAFLLNFIPSVGSVIATLLPIPIAIAQFDNIWIVIGVVTFPGIVQMTIGNFIEPKVMGDGLQLHPASILLALAFWGLLWGPVGMLLGVPITATIRIILMRFETTRPIADMLAGKMPAELQQQADA